MKIFNINLDKRRVKMFSASLLSGTMILAALTGCANNKHVESIPDSNVDTQIESTESTYIEPYDSPYMITSEPTSDKENYDFPWERDENIYFDIYLQKKYNISLSNYVRTFGLTGELNRYYTQFINQRFNTDYDRVDFSKANYFYMYVADDNAHKNKFDDFEYFRAAFLNNSFRTIFYGFNNKLVFSYMISNNVPLGCLIPIENLKRLDEDALYSTEIRQYIYDNPDLGNYGSSHIYSSEELCGLLKEYNASVTYICVDKGIKTMNVFDDPEAVEICNQHLKTFYGENAPQLGQYITREQYMAIFGEEPLDVSYIPGAIVDINEVKAG